MNPNQPPMESTQSVVLPKSDSTPDEVKECVRLLEEGQTRVKTGQQDVVAVVGMTGSGKTTLVKFLTSDNDDLQAEEVAENLGEFTITDKEQKISSDTIVSQTIFPELYVDPVTQTTFYDSPGFSDTRGLSVDIAGAYFLHKILAESKKIRLVLTANFTSVRRGSDRGDFLELLKHVLHLVKNVGPYVDSVALVITKVDNQMMKKGAEIVLVPDETVLENVAKFLKDFKNDIPKVAEGAVAENLSLLVDTLLKKKSDSTYERLALFRRPDEAGSLSKMELLQEGKATIKKVISQNLKSVAPRLDDFGFAISEASKNRLHEVAAKINENVAAQIVEEYKTKLNDGDFDATLVDMYQKNEAAQKDFEKFKNWFLNLPQELPLDAFIDQLSTITGSMSEKISLTDVEKSRILSKGEYLSFLETIGGKKLDGTIFAWKKGLKPYSDHLENTAKWYEFLTNLHQVLSSYPVQKRYRDFSSLLQKKVTHLDEVDFVKLLDFCNSLTRKFENFQPFALDDRKSAQLNKVLESTLSPETNEIYDLDSDTFEIRGKFVKLSDYVDNKGMTAAKFINIFASEKLFIDANVTRDQEKLQGVTLMAPTWEVVGDDVRINLNGKNGCCKYSLRADDGGPFWTRGGDGQPGVAGKSAANFLGLATDVINGEHLRISANGGDGSAGQDGGRGGNGRDGASPITENPWGCSSNNIDRFMISKLGGFVRRVYCVYGDRGTDGGAGGNGGIGGLGGKAGKVEIQVYNDASKPRVEAKDGAAGRPGSGGEGGQGGKAGRSWNHQKMLWWWKDASCSNSRRLANEYGDCAITDNQRHGRRGERGVAGAHWEGAEVPQSATAINAAAVVAAYLEFLHEKATHDVVHRLPKDKFAQNLENKATSAELKREPEFEFLGRPAMKVQKVGLKRSKRGSHFDKFGFMKDCFRVPQWPVTSRITQEDFTADSSLAPQISIQFPINEALLLTNLIVGKFNKSNPNYLQHCAVDHETARFCAAEILNKFVGIWSDVDNNGITADIDPVVTMEKLENEIINGSRENIGQILIDSLESQSLDKKEELNRRLQTVLGIN